MPVLIPIPARPGFPAADVYTRKSTPGDLIATTIDDRYPTVVFIPIIWTDSFFFYPQFDDPALFEHHNLIAIDPRFLGLTRSQVGSGRYDWKAVADDLEAVLNILGVTTVHLVGLSMGANSALHFAAKYPTRVASLCLINRVPERPDPTWEEAKHDLKQTFDTAVLDQNTDLIDAITAAAFDYGVGSSQTGTTDEFKIDMMEFQRARLLAGDLARSAPFLEAMLESRSESVSSSSLGGVTCPILFSRGTGDGCEPAEADEPFVAALNTPRAAVQVLEGLPRWMTWTSPNIINPILAYHLLPTSPSSPITPLLPVSPLTARSVSRRPSTPRDVSGYIIPPRIKAPPGTLTVGEMLDRQEEEMMKRRTSLERAGGVIVQTEVIVVVEES